MMDSLILVNRAHPLPAPPDPAELAPVDEDHPDILLCRDARAWLERLLDAVGARGAIVPVSGFRSRAEQQAIWDGSLAEHGRAFTETYVARPGCSEHETGLAIDLAENRPDIDFLCPQFPDEGVCRLFRLAAPEFGFVLRYPAGKEHRSEEHTSDLQSR